MLLHVKRFNKFNPISLDRRKKPRKKRFGIFLQEPIINCLRLLSRLLYSAPVLSSFRMFLFFNLSRIDKDFFFNAFSMKTLTKFDFQ